MRLKLWKSFEHPEARARSSASSPQQMLSFCKQPRPLLRISGNQIPFCKSNIDTKFAGAKGPSAMPKVNGTKPCFHHKPFHKCLLPPKPKFLISRLTERGTAPDLKSMPNTNKKIKAAAELQQGTKPLEWVPSHESCQWFPATKIGCSRVTLLWEQLAVLSLMLYSMIEWGIWAPVLRITKADTSMLRVRDYIFTNKL